MIAAVSLGLFLNDCVTDANRRDIAAIVYVESANSPTAVAGIGTAFSSLNTSLSSAIEAANSVLASGHRVAVGLGQINSVNIHRLHLEGMNLFDPCINLQVAERVLRDCLERAPAVADHLRHQQAWSCYFSGDFRTGFYRPQSSPYVERVEAASRRLGGSVLQHSRSLK